jgi:hypothetical protein
MGGPGQRVLDDLFLGLGASALEQVHDLGIQPSDKEDDCADHRYHQQAFHGAFLSGVKNSALELTKIKLAKELGENMKGK